jgi:hypothetical protein
MIHGNTHSRNAREAEERGELPLTRAVEAVYAALDCKRLKVTKRKVREFLEQTCYTGWHHVAGPSVREVAYYRTTLTDEEKAELLVGAKGAGSG